MSGVDCEADRAEAAFVGGCMAVRPQALAMAGRILDDVGEVEDAYQAAVCVAWEKRARFRGDSRWSTWFLGITRNVSFDMRRRRQRQQQVPPPLLADANPLNGEAFESEVVRRDAVAAALGELPVVLCQAVVLREFGDLTYNDIADVEGIPLNTAKSRVARARRHLQRTLAA